MKGIWGSVAVVFIGLLFVVLGVFLSAPDPKRAWVSPSGDVFVAEGCSWVNNRCEIETPLTGTAAGTCLRNTWASPRFGWVSCDPPPQSEAALIVCRGGR